MKKTRIAGLHVDDSKPVVGEEVRIAGLLQYYDEKEKTWKPLRAWVKLYVDGIEVDRTPTKPNGSFEFRYSSNVTGKRKIEVRFAGDRFKPCKKEIEVEFVTAEEKRRVDKIAKLALLVLFVLILLIFVLSVILSKW